MTDPTTDVTVSQVLMVSIDSHIIVHVMERAWEPVGNDDVVDLLFYDSGESH